MIRFDRNEIFFKQESLKKRDRLKDFTAELSKSIITKIFKMFCYKKAILLVGRSVGQSVGQLVGRLIGWSIRP